MFGLAKATSRTAVALSVRRFCPGSRYFSPALNYHLDSPNNNTNVHCEFPKSSKERQRFPTTFQKYFFTSYISSRGHFSTMSREPPHTSMVDNAKADIDFKSDDNAAQEVAPHIKTKRLDKTARHIMQILEKEAVQSVKEERVIPDIKPGYIVELKVEVPENKRRVSSLKGIVIAKRNAGLSTTFRIRRLVAGVGVESVFPLYSPNIKQIKVLDKKRVRRAKLYYLREKMGSSGKK